MNTAAATNADPDAAPDGATSTRARRRWFRFRLRTLLVVVTLAGCGLGWLGVKVREARQQQANVAALWKLGCIVQYDYEYDPQSANPGHLVPNATPSGPAWLRRMLGDDFFQSVYVVDYPQVFSDNPVRDADLERLRGFRKLNSLDLNGAQVADAGLANLKGLTQLEVLDIGYTRVTDAGLVYLGGLTKLEALSLDSTQITDAGIAHLKRLTNLQNLDLRNTRITDAGLQQLAGLPNLSALWLEGTDVTAAGVAKFKKALPNCQIPDHP